MKKFIYKPGLCIVSLTIWIVIFSFIGCKEERNYIEEVVANEINVNSDRPKIRIAMSAAFVSEAGMNDYVSKPVNVQELADAIKRNIRDGKKHPSLLLSPPMESESKQSTQDVPGVIYSEYEDDPDLVEVIDEFAAGLRIL